MNGIFILAPDVLLSEVNFQFHSPGIFGAVLAYNTIISHIFGDLAVT